VFLGLTCNESNTKAPTSRRPTATTLGHHGARLQQRRHSSVAVHGETTTEPVLSGSTACSQAGIQRKETAQRKARLRVGSRWVGDVVVASLTKVATPGRRSRWCPASCTARPSARHGRSPPRAATGPAPHVLGRPPAAARRRQRDARLPPSCLHSPSPLRRHTQEEGKNPGRLGWQGGGSVPGVVDARSKRRRGKDASALQDWPPERDWRRGL
jgi:hypothetical protein